MDRNNSNDRTTAGVIAATMLLASVALLALAGLTGGICAAIDENAGGSEGEMTGAAVSAASVTTSINYQGRLTDSSGSPLTGTYTMTFGLYDVSTGGTALDTDTHVVMVTDGLFNTGIDFDQSYFDGGALWLGVTVGTDSEMTPRQELRPVPYAMSALSLVPGANIIGSAPVALHAESTHSSGRGIRGYATATSGTNYGVVGASKSPDGYGGYFYNNGGGIGVYGKGRYGGYFTTDQGGTGGFFPVYNAAVNATTTHNYSDGVHTKTTGYGSAGVRAYTAGGSSHGVKASTDGDWSYGVCAYSRKSYAIYADTGRFDGNYSFYTPNDNIYVGGKIDVVGAVDPIITECFNADPAVDYEVGDVVTLGEDSPYVKPCTEADDTKVVGVVGPTLDIEDGEISVVIMGYRGARPDEEHVKVLEMRLSDAEARMAEVDLRMSGAEAESVDEKNGMENEVAMLRSEIEEAKSVTRQVVKVKVDASHAPIKRGDLLTTSPTKGHAMKALPVEFGGVEIQRPGTMIGKALEPLDSGTGLIEVFVTLQ